MVFYDSADIYTSILSPFKEDILKINTTLRTNPEKAEKILEKAKGHIQEFLECGLSDIDNPSNMSTYSNDGYFFRHKSLSKVLLVEARGIEPLSEDRITGFSPSAGRILDFPCPSACERAMGLGSFILPASPQSLGGPVPHINDAACQSRERFGATRSH